MITKLVENSKKKADKYWPGQNDVAQYSGYFQYSGVIKVQGYN